MKEETKSMFVGVAIGVLLAAFSGLFLYDFAVSDLNSQIENMTNNTQLIYDYGFYNGAVYVANYTTLTGNFSYFSDGEIKTYPLEDYYNLISGVDDGR